MFYCDWKINIADILVNLSIVILTTGITYFLFSVLPAKRRKQTLKYRLQNFRDELKEYVLYDQEKFKKSYELFDEELPLTENGEEITEVWSLIRILNWSDFLSYFRSFSLLDTYFNDYWQGKELMLLVNNLFIDNKRYISLSMKLSQLNAEIVHSKALLGKIKNKIWKIETEDELIKKKRDNELVSFIISSFEDIQHTSHEIVQEIDQIVKIKSDGKTGAGEHLKPG